MLQTICSIYKCKNQINYTKHTSSCGSCKAFRKLMYLGNTSGVRALFWFESWSLNAILIWYHRKHTRGTECTLVSLSRKLNIWARTFRGSTLMLVREYASRFFFCRVGGHSVDTSHRSSSSVSVSLSIVSRSESLLHGASASITKILESIELHSTSARVQAT